MASKAQRLLTEAQKTDFVCYLHCCSVRERPWSKMCTVGHTYRPQAGKYRNGPSVASGPKAHAYSWHKELSYFRIFYHIHLDAATIFRHCAWILASRQLSCSHVNFYVKIDLCKKRKGTCSMLIGLIDYRIDLNGRSLIQYSLPYSLSLRFGSGSNVQSGCSVVIVFLDEGLFTQLVHFQ